MSEYSLLIIYYLLKMPAKKPKSQHRIPLIVSCSAAQKQEIDKVLSQYPIRYRSKYLINFLKRAIAQNKTDLADEESYWHGTKKTFQISCLPEEKQLIDDFCNEHLPLRKRSRWIVQRILELANIL